ncbi:hypothetical protein DL96DRAFT_109580 [Flagelloscypha sp. PMI_526]|nr:hypothetical protein DL96DRAFT_109580 [Flagelloscypha sp. PMI_526]
MYNSHHFNQQCPICLSNKAFNLEASTVLYRHMSFNDSSAVDRFLSSTSHRIHLIRHLSLCILYSSSDAKSWIHLFSALRYRALRLLSLRIMSHKNGPMASSDFQAHAGALLSIPSLEYVAVTTMMVPIVTAYRCPALKELDTESCLDDLTPGGSLSRALTELSVRDEKKKLDTLCCGRHNASPKIVQGLFDLRGLTRLSINRPLHEELYGGMHTYQLLDEVCLTLQELAICLPAPLDKVLFSPRVHDLELYWSMSDHFISSFISIAPKLREVYLRLDDWGPDDILSGNGDFLPTFDPQLEVIHFFCFQWIKLGIKGHEARCLLKKRLGPGRDVQVHWWCELYGLTTFCEPISNLFRYNVTSK